MTAEEIHGEGKAIAVAMSQMFQASFELFTKIWKDGNPPPSVVVNFNEFQRRLEDCQFRFGQFVMFSGLAQPGAAQSVIQGDFGNGKKEKE